MNRRKERQVARRRLTSAETEPAEALAAARWLQKDGAITAAREALDGRAAAGANDETTRRLRIEFTLRDVEGLGDAKRLAEAERLLDAERDPKGRLPAAFAPLGAVWDRQDALYKAEQIFSGTDPGAGKTLIKLAKRLKAHSDFSAARRLFGKAKARGDLEPARELYASQQEALCTYKDPAMPRAARLDDALKLLQRADLRDDRPSAESLGLAGAIYKRKWELGNRLADLRESRRHYQAGHDESETNQPTRAGDPDRGEDPNLLYRNPDWDAGYNGINAAFLGDKLASLEPDVAMAGNLRDAASQLRESLVASLERFLGDSRIAEESKRNWWLLATLVEAAFGLALHPEPSVDELDERFAPLERWIDEARGLAGTPDWEVRSTATQLVELTRVLRVDVRQPKDPLARRARQALERFLGPERAGCLDVILRGKVGLALSGGGFRASLYHIGVLAKLAELDVLRHVEVLSCVSGGSIIGAHYYLELRRWLQEHEDSEILDANRQIDREHYVKIVERVQRSFLAGVQENLRMRVATNPKTALETMLRPTYSRTERLGELYDRHLFRRVDDGESHRPRMLDELLIEPKGTEPMAFVPPRDNWLRRTPIPVLVLNATTLNTGHNWQFTATWMGESRWSIDDDIDGNARLRRPYYWQAPEEYRKLPLGRAVAASSCVPGLFEPVMLPRLYPGYAVRLVDGGVHDNQGVASLLEQDCSWVIVSDASGQMTTEPLIDGGSMQSFGRTSNIQMARIREEQLKGVETLLDGRRLRGSVTVHLREGLAVEPVPWEGCEEKREPASAHGFALEDVRKDVLEPLAGIRTDLDSFTDTEAYALMAAGYKMIEAKQDGFAKDGLGSPADTSFGWKFLDLVPPMKDKKNPDHADLKRQLRVGGSLAGKIWRLEPLRSLLLLVLVLGVLGASGWAVWTLGLDRLVAAAWAGLESFGWQPGRVLGLAFLAVLLGLFAAKAISNRATLGTWFVRHAFSSLLFSLLLLVLWPVAWIQLLVFDRSFLARGRVP